MGITGGEDVVQHGKVVLAAEWAVVYKTWEGS